MVDPLPRGDFNLRILRGLAQSLGTHTSAGETERLASEAGLLPEDLEEGGQWATHAQVETFLRGARAAFPDDDAFRRACASGLRQGLGPLALLAFAGEPLALFERVAAHQGEVARGTALRVRRGGPRRIEATYSSPYPESRLLCLLRQGQLGALPTIRGLPGAEVRETACIAGGAGECVYSIEWQAGPARLPLLLGAAGGLALALTLRAAGAADALSQALLPALGLAAGALVSARQALRAQATGIDRSHDAIWQLAREESTTRNRLRESESLHRQITEASLDLVLTLDALGMVRYATPSAEQVLGLSAEELVGRPFADLMQDDAGAAVSAELLLPTRSDVDVLLPARSDVDVLLPAADPRVAESELRFRHADGRLRRVEARARAFRGADGKPVTLVTIRDLSERRRLEEQLLHAQKMESIGRLAGAVAHDFNNLLTVIVGYTDLLSDRLAAGDLKPVHEIRRAADRATALTRQLLSFSRRQPIEPRLVDLAAAIAEIEPMIRRLLGATIEVRVVTTGGLQLVFVDPGQVHQLLMNLAVNARDAMPGGGKLTIEACPVTLDAVYARQHADVRPGEYVLLAVSDTGRGMDPEVRARVFEPFFTTKAKGRGTGLGLATCYGIVKQAQGHIWFYSEPGAGTTFKVYLPRREGVAAAPEKAEARAAVPRGMETVLVVEDEPALRVLETETLALLGYRVLHSEDGEEGLRVAAAHAGAIHLLLTDLVMPRMGGAELAARLRLTRPQTRVLYVSGYTPDAVIGHGMLASGVDFLQKPFSPESLAHRVRQVLDGRPLPSAGTSG